MPQQREHSIPDQVGGGFLSTYHRHNGIGHHLLLCLAHHVPIKLPRKTYWMGPRDERFSHGAPCFFVQDTRAVCYYHDNHRGDGRISLWREYDNPMVSAAAIAKFAEDTPGASA